MKKDVAEFVDKWKLPTSKLWTSKSCGFASKNAIPKLNREIITMDFVFGIPNNLWIFASIWVVVDRLTKSAHLVSVKVDYNA